MGKKLDNSLKMVVKSSFIVFFSLILSKALTYVYRVIIARYFGPEVYGLFTLSTTILSLFVFFFSLGLSEGLSRFIPLLRGKERTDQINYLIHLTILISIISGIIGTFLLFTFSEEIAIRFFNNSQIIIYLQIFSFLIPIMILGQIFLNILRSYELINWFSFIFNILQNLVKVILIILFIFIGLNSNSIIFSHFLGISSMLFLAYFVCKYKLPKILNKYFLSKSIKIKVRKSFFSYSLPIMPFTIISILFYWIDSFSIGYFLDVSMVGFYNSAVPIAALLTITPEIFIQLFFPMINKEYSFKNLKLIKQISQQVGKWILIINLPIFILMFLFPGLLINLLFGTEYLVALGSLRFLAIGAFISSLGVISINLVSMVGKSRLFTLNIFLASFSNLFLNWLFVPKYGIIGASSATMISVILLQILFFIEARYYTSIIPFRSDFFRIILAFIVPTGIVLLLRKLISVNIFSLIFLGTIFLIVYSTMILLFKCLDKHDLMIFNALKCRFLSSFHKTNNL